MLDIHIFSILYALAVIVFATLAAINHYALIAYIAGFVLSIILIGTSQIPNTATIGLLIAFAGFLQLTRPRYYVLVSTCGGVLVGIWSNILQHQGIPMYPSILIAVVVPSITVLLVKQRFPFISLSISEESLIIMILLGLASAMIPDIISGWQSATILNRDALETGRYNISPWIIIMAILSLFSGSLYAAWKHQ